MVHSHIIHSQLQVLSPTVVDGLEVVVDCECALKLTAHTEEQAQSSRQCLQEPDIALVIHGSLAQCSEDFCEKIINTHNLPLL